MLSSVKRYLKSDEETWLDYWVECLIAALNVPDENVQVFISIGNSVRNIFFFFCDLQTFFHVPSLKQEAWLCILLCSECCVWPMSQNANNYLPSLKPALPSLCGGFSQHSVNSTLTGCCWAMGVCPVLLHGVEQLPLHRGLGGILCHARLHVGCARLKVFIICHHKCECSNSCWLH